MGDFFEEDLTKQALEVMKSIVVPSKERARAQGDVEALERCYKVGLEIEYWLNQDKDAMTDEELKNLLLALKGLPSEWPE